MDTLHWLLVFGTFFYMVTALASSYVAIYGQIDKQMTTWIGKLVVHYGIFNIMYWALAILLLVTRKIGMLLFV